MSFADNNGDRQQYMRRSRHRTQTYFLTLAFVATFVPSSGCGPATHQMQSAVQPEQTQPKQIENLTELYVNDKRSAYKNAVLNVEGIELQFDHRCTMFGWYEFSCEFPTRMKNETVANAFQIAWDDQRIEGLPGVAVERDALQCLEETTKTSVPVKKVLDCKPFDLSVNAFRAVNGSRNELWLRFEKKKEEVSR